MNNLNWTMIKLKLRDLCSATHLPTCTVTRRRISAAVTNFVSSKNQSNTPEGAKNLKKEWEAEPKNGLDLSLSSAVDLISKSKVEENVLSHDWGERSARQQPSTPAEGIGLQDTLVDSPSWQTYLQKIVKGKDRASRTIAVKLSSTNLNAVQKSLEELGETESIDWFKVNSKVYSYLALVEYKDLHTVDAIVKELSAIENGFVTNSNCRLLKYTDQSNDRGSVLDRELRQIATENAAILRFNPQSLVNDIKSSDHLDDTILKVARSFGMSELQMKLNYFTCQIVDDALRRNFPNGATIPHGSTMSSLASREADLDLIFHPFSGLHIYMSKDPNLTSESPSPFKPIHSGLIAENVFSESEVIKYLKFVLRFFVGGCTQLHAIPHARVPIIRFREPVMSCQCDLQFSRFRNDSLSASYMISCMCNLEPRLRPLIQSLKIWADKNDLMSSAPHNCFTNFSLAHMVIYYFQQQQMLPPAKLIYNAEVNIEDKLGYCTDQHPRAFSDIGKLYADFFNFWRQFDFNYIVDIGEGKVYLPDKNTSKDLAYSPLKIVNTLFPSKNIARMTNDKTLKQFVKMANKTMSINSSFFYLHSHCF